MSCVTGLHGGVPRDRQGQVEGGTACREHHPHQPAARRRGLACMHYIIRIRVLSSSLLYCQSKSHINSFYLKEVRAYGC